MKTYLITLLLLVLIATGCSSDDDDIVIPTRFVTEIPSETPLPTATTHVQAQVPTLPPSETPTVTSTVTATPTATATRTTTPTPTPVCPSVAETAFNNFAQLCSQTGAGQICNVHNRVDAPLFSGVLGLTEVGEMVNVAEVQTLYSMPYDERDGTWGMAYIKSNPVESASILAYGDFTLTFGQSFIMQYTAGFDATPPCENLPASGLLIITDGEAQYNINGTDIIANSVTLIQIVDDYMNIMSVDGTTTVSAIGATKVIPAGNFSRVRVQANAPIVPPEAAQPYTEDMLIALPDARFYGGISVATAGEGGSSQRIGPAFGEEDPDTLRFQIDGLPRLAIPTPEPVVSALNTTGELVINTITERTFHAQLKTTYTVSAMSGATPEVFEFIWFDGTFNDFGNGLWNDENGNSLIFTDECTISTGSIKDSAVPYDGEHYRFTAGANLPDSSFIDTWSVIQCGDIEPE